MRGQLTNEIQTVAVSLLGRGITTTELRLMPYAQYQMMNEQKLAPNKLSAEERKVWQTWKQEGYVTGGMTGMTMTREFWDIINEILWFSYVAHDEATP